MRIVAVVPVKALNGAKTRLAALLAPEERAALTLRTLRVVLAALNLPAIATRVVVSPDEAVLAEARAAGAVALRQEGDGLNPALDQARAWALAHGADALLVVLGDLPLLHAEDIAELLDLADAPRTVVFAPDRHGLGTNALLQDPAGAIPFAFGAGSFARHHDAALGRGCQVRLYHSSGTAFDLDTPDDLAAIDALAVGVGGERD